ncbi:hypothetical protein GALMADRAFT_1124347 [Galerina marginata CBS 339.88]|uniref:Uncharacterized protein n=1 Tax=Galerina marginata (strain CBS 339.88) TaxID=685588 RepID=A0A067TFT7_GALM3|nr:hypothetical protein GALMADRAFT_1124347 [Galerina marginata CBS 339.88]
MRYSYSSESAIKPWTSMRTCIHYDIMDILCWPAFLLPHCRFIGVVTVAYRLITPASVHPASLLGCWDSWSSRTLTLRTPRVSLPYGPSFFILVTIGRLFCILRLFNLRL